MAVVVVTDSSASVPADLIGELGIAVVPLHVLVDDRAIGEGAGISISTTAPRR